MTLAAGATVLVTGAEGFVGRWLVEALRGAGHPVIGTCRPGVPRHGADVRWLEVDLGRAGALDAVLEESRPAALVHLAAIALPRRAARDPDEALRVNYTAVDHLVRSLAACRHPVRLLYVSSGEVYGRRPVGAPPAREDDPLRPPGPYAATKAAAEQRVVHACERDGLDAIRARPFNHSGPGRPSDYAESSFARQVAELERCAGEPVVRVGNLAPLRDYSHVADVVAAYRLLLERGESGRAYNVCSGEPRSLQSVVDALLSRARRPLRCEVDDERFEPIPDEALQLAGDPARMRALGWSPDHSFESMLDALLDDWRSRA